MFSLRMNKTLISKTRFGRIQSHILPVIVWLAAVGCMVVLFQHRTQRFEVVGIAQSQVRQIAATCTGRLETVPVELFNSVSQGQTVAVINTVPDNEDTEAQLAVVSAEIERLRAELIATQDRFVSDASELQADIISTNRRFDVDVESARIQILELKSQIESDRIIAQDLALEVQIAKDLLQQDAIAPYELQKTKNQYNALTKKIEEYEQMLSQASLDLEKAQLRRSEFSQNHPTAISAENTLEVIRKAIAVQEQMMAGIMSRREMLTLKSPIGGMVNQILKGPGEIVLASEPILSVAELQPSHVVAYVDENLVGHIQERTVVQLIKTGNPGQIAESQIVSLGSTIEMLPQRLWRNPSVEQWGRPILIAVPPGLNLLPNQTVGIRGL